MDKKLAEKAKQAKSEAELSRMAKQEGIALSDSQAEEVYQRFHSENQELSDEELNNVSGGGCSSAKELGAKYQKVNPGSIGGGFVWSYGQISRTDDLRELPLGRQRRRRFERSTLLIAHCRDQLFLRETAALIPQRPKGSVASTDPFFVLCR